MYRVIQASIKDQALNDYLNSHMSVKQICAKYGIAYRTMYNLRSKQNIAKRRTQITNDRKMIYLSRNEIECILLMIFECDKHLGKWQPIATALENKLLTIADEMEEMKNVYK